MHWRNTFIWRSERLFRSTLSCMTVMVGSPRHRSRLRDQMLPHIPGSAMNRATDAQLRLSWRQIAVWKCARLHTLRASQLTECTVSGMKSCAWKRCVRDGTRDGWLQRARAKGRSAPGLAVFNRALINVLRRFATADENRIRTWVGAIVSAVAKN